jgi:tryptophan-rich sensory protein
MGLASYLVGRASVPEAAKSRAQRVYALQLGFNFFWSILFFRLGLYYTAFVWLVALWVLILVTAVRFFRIDKRAAYLLIPYLVWVTFAGYLNLGVAMLN